MKTQLSTADNHYPIPHDQMFNNTNLMVFFYLLNITLIGDSYLRQFINDIETGCDNNLFKILYEIAMYFTIDSHKGETNHYVRLSNTLHTICDHYHL